MQVVERFIEIKGPEGLARIEGLDRLPPFNPEELVRHAPDSHWLLLENEGKPAGRCSLWWRNSPPYPGHRVGAIGHYAAADALAASTLLRHACAELSSYDCTLAVGPMDGNTWRSYRLITDRGTEPAFFLEPNHPDDWPRHFQAEGFEVLANYSSALNADLTYEDPRAKQVWERLAAQGMRLRPLDLQNFDQELRGIYAVSRSSFQNGFLYTAITEMEFLEQFLPLQGSLSPDLIWIAEHEKRIVGYIFTLPDLLQAKRGQVVDTAIIKTLAVLPRRTYAGLGAVLVARSQIAARELGYQRVIHALMHESNSSRNISARYAKLIRRYALFAKGLRS